MYRQTFLLLTAVAEAVTGFFLLLFPAVPLALLLGLQGASVETLFVARVAGSALIAIALTSGLARDDGGGAALRAVLAGLLLYDLAVAGVLAYAGLEPGLVGILLWPAVLAHLTLALWCAGCLSAARGDTPTR